jgi:hypothetical protein
MTSWPEGGVKVIEVLCENMFFKETAGNPALHFVAIITAQGYGLILALYSSDGGSLAVVVELRTE